MPSSKNGCCCFAVYKKEIGAVKEVGLKNYVKYSIKGKWDKTQIQIHIKRT